LATEGENETSDACLQKVIYFFEDLGVLTPNEVIDRAHRIGKIQW